MIRKLLRPIKQQLVRSLVPPQSIPVDRMDLNGVHLQPETFLNAVGLGSHQHRITEQTCLDTPNLVGIALNVLHNGSEDPGPEILYETGNTLLSMGRVDVATPVLKDLLERVRTTRAHQTYLHCLLLNPDISGEDLYREATAWAHLYAVDEREFDLPPLKQTSRSGPIRIGYVCEFFDSAVMRSAMLPTIGALDRTKFETFCYSDGRIPEDHRHCSDHWHETASLSDVELCALVRSHQIDILVDLSGPTQTQRFPAYALRCAPHQMGGPNFAATSGMPFFDFMIASEGLIPQNHESHFCETIYRSPYFVAFSTPAQPSYEKQVPVAPPPVLKNGHITFGYFGSTHKINPHIVKVWSAILSAVPDSRMILKAAGYDHSLIKESVADLFAQNHIEASRLEFRGLSSYTDLLAEYADIDIAVDAQPVSGGATLNDLLWQGVPCISVLGNRLSARHGAVRLITGDMDDCVAESNEDCAEIAKMLSSSLDALSERRMSQRDSLMRTKLFDPAGFGQALEEVFEKVALKYI